MKPCGGVTKRLTELTAAVHALVVAVLAVPHSVAEFAEVKASVGARTLHMIDRTSHFYLSQAWRRERNSGRLTLRFKMTNGDRDYL